MISTDFNDEGLANININGKTQFRVYFESSTNNDNNSDYLSFYSGEDAQQYQPKLKITYLTNGTPIEEFSSREAEDGRIYARYISSAWVSDGVISNDLTSQALRIGDYETTGPYSYKNIVSFDTSSLPDDCNIISAKLQLIRGYSYGTDPFTWTGNPECLIDIANPYFGSSINLELDDWDASADDVNVASFSADPGQDQAMVSTEFDQNSLTFINKTGTTQLRFYIDSYYNNDATDDFLGFYPGEQTATDKEPKLIIQYQINP